MWEINLCCSLSNSKWSMQPGCCAIDGPRWYKNNKIKTNIQLSWMVYQKNTYIHKASFNCCMSSIYRNRYCKNSLSFYALHILLQQIMKKSTCWSECAYLIVHIISEILQYAGQILILWRSNWPNILSLNVWHFETMKLLLAHSSDFHMS